MRLSRIFIVLSILASAVPVEASSKLERLDSKAGVMFDARLDKGQRPAELLLSPTSEYSDEGLLLKAGSECVRLDRYYALAERMVRYRVRPSADAVLHFRSSLGDFNVFMDVPGKKVSIMTSPATEVSAPFLEGDRDYIVEIYHIYNKAVVRVREASGKNVVEVSAVNDGQGGCNSGKLQDGFSVGMQWDHYWFRLDKGSSALVRRITVLSLKKKVRLLIYGDSITQPEGYFPAKDFQNAWTQRIIAHEGGSAMSSGRGGCTINEVLVYIKNELPYIKSKYVMVTIGTNGGNTYENLTELVQYIKSQGRIPVLNNIPCNESGTQIAVNEIVAKVRADQGIRGCLFDVATSLKGDGREVNKSMMFHEDLVKEYNWDVYHHPNWEGGRAMFERTLTDTPDIYRK